MQRDPAGAGKAQYLAPSRLGDVLALIQVLALDKTTHRSEADLCKELQGEPRSATSWSAIATAHPEFFRLNVQKNSPISLVARHVTPKDEDGVRNLSTEFTAKLIAVAIELHDREVRRSQSWQVWLPVLGAVVGGALALLGVWLESHLG